MKFKFDSIVHSKNAEKFNAPIADWSNWQWQMRQALKTQKQFETYFKLSSEEIIAFEKSENIFNQSITPYYASLADSINVYDPLRRIMVPHASELTDLVAAELDPLGERKPSNQPVQRVIHRYSDRALFLVTDICSVYCRYCTRKHFTGLSQAFPKNDEYETALNYFRTHKGIREVILSGGDPLTLSDQQLEKVLNDLRSIEHIEIIRIGSRMPVVCPMRITPNLVKTLQKYKPVYLMTHFNHPKEITLESASALEMLVDHGVPVMNQMVLLNGVNNHAAIVQALSRRLVYLRVKPYYMFQCDPSQGTDYLRTSIDQSLEIQKELWGHLSGLAMPNFSVDIPNGGGKAYYTPQFEVSKTDGVRTYVGWDGVHAQYVNPDPSQLRRPWDYENYMSEWNEIKNSKSV